MSTPFFRKSRNTYGELPGFHGKDRKRRELRSALRDAFQHARLADLDQRWEEWKSLGEECRAHSGAMDWFLKETEELASDLLIAKVRAVGSGPVYSMTMDLVDVMRAYALTERNNLNCSWDESRRITAERGVVSLDDYRPRRLVALRNIPEDDWHGPCRLTMLRYVSSCDQHAPCRRVLLWKVSTVNRFWLRRITVVRGVPLGRALISRRRRWPLCDKKRKGRK
jgi:hypothetical protein